MPSGEILVSGMTYTSLTGPIGGFANRFRVLTTVSNDAILSDFLEVKGANKEVRMTQEVPMTQL